MTHKEDILMHAGEDYQKFLGAVVPPIFQNTLFVQPTEVNGVETDEYIYTRINNPTTEIVEKKIALLENGEQALAFSSGMGAISAGILRCIQAKSHVICVETAYGPTRNLLEMYLNKFDISVTFVQGNDLNEIKNAITDKTTLIYLESPSSFIYCIQNLNAIAHLAKENNIYTMIDNSYGTPLYQNPLNHGIDLVAHTVSKYIGGHSDVTGRILVGRSALLESMIEEERALLGAIMDPHQAWLVLRGMRTLSVRLKEHERNARKVIDFLLTRKEVKRLYYPGHSSHPDYDLAVKQMTGFNGLLSVELNGTEKEQLSFINKLNYFQLGVSWGGYESLIANITIGKTVPGVPQGLVRLHVGLEAPQTLIEDLERSFKLSF